MREKNGEIQQIKEKRQPHLPKLCAVPSAGRLESKKKEPSITRETRNTGEF